MPLVSRIIFKISLCLVSLVTIAQTNNIAIGQWRAHLPFNKSHLVADAGDQIYCASQSGMFSLNKSDNSLSVISKVQGLSDVSISALNYYQAKGILMIGYENGNIDIVKGSAVTNIPDIKRKQLNARKVINRIFFKDNYAYLACGFGIVVLDLDKNEVRDTYLIGPNGSFLNVYDFTSDNLKFYAATETGLFTANVTEPNLTNYQFWNREPITNNTSVNNGVFNGVVFFNGDVYANYSRFETTGQVPKDTIYRKTTTEWSRTNLAEHYGLHSFSVTGNNLVIACNDVVFTYRPDSSNSYSNFYLDGPSAARDAVMDNEDNLWIADFNRGLIKRDKDFKYQLFYPAGPVSLNVSDLTARGDEIWVSPGGKNISWTQQYINSGISVLKNNEWKHIKNAITDTVYDILTLDVNPVNNEQLFGASWGYGIIEFNAEDAVTSYNTDGTKLQIQQKASNWHQVRVGDVDFDKEGNAWMSNWWVQNPLVVYTKDKTWDSFNFSTIVNFPEVGRVLANSYNQVWIQVRSTGKGGILVYDHAGTIEDHSDDRYTHLNINGGQGALPSNEVLTFVEDKDGSIWVGTDKGVAVFYNPANIFTGENFDAQSVLINQDGHTQKLLETETVTSIVVDGGNRKWFGTQNSGIYLMSGDGTKQLEHFTAENSPLFSNTIIAMEINPVTGELFVATEKGIVSYKGTATEGISRCEGTYAYPNPVRPGYSGYIAVKGLVTNAHVRITDIAGNLVYETRAIGGQAVWDGKNMNGERVQSGVYIAFASNDDKSETCVTKILFVN